MAQFRYARNVVKMSVTDFVSLAERIGDPTVPVIWTSKTGRCGGTLLCRVFEYVPGTLVIQQPDPPLHLCHLQEKCTYIESQYEAMLKSTIRVLSKQHPGIKMICIKPRARSTAIMKDLTRLLPNLKHIFMYRNPLGTILSKLRMMYCEPFPAVLCSFALYSEWLSKICP